MRFFGISVFFRTNFKLHSELKNLVNIVLLKRKIMKEFLTIISIGYFIFILTTPVSSISIALGSIEEDIKFPYIIKSANNDTTAPIITFLNPTINNTLIRTDSYEFIVNITDANPPLPGNVSIEISSNSTSLFNASMILSEDDIWLFSWVNLTSYPNNEAYVIRITAKDSSLNENYGYSYFFNVILDFYDETPPSLISLIFYLIGVVVIFTLIKVYVNKKSLKTVKE